MKPQELTSEEALAAVKALPADKAETLRKYALNAYAVTLNQYNERRPVSRDEYVRDCMADALRSILAGRDTWERIAAAFRIKKP